jgi:hypothetical protein
LQRARIAAPVFGDDFGSSLAQDVTQYECGDDGIVERSEHRNEFGDEVYR